jgi:hypothetical protein
MPSIVTRARFAVICVLGVIVASQPVKFDTKCSAMLVAISRSVGGESVRGKYPYGGETAPSGCKFDSSLPVVQPEVGRAWQCHPVESGFRPVPALAQALNQRHFGWSNTFVVPSSTTFPWSSRPCARRPPENHR